GGGGGGGFALPANATTTQGTTPGAEIPQGASGPEIPIAPTGAETIEPPGEDPVPASDDQEPETQAKKGIAGGLWLVAGVMAIIILAVLGYNRLRKQQKPLA
ncbi:MAG: hypothetical protein AABX51_04315, partial [Nanoarchaeota archaeon]